MKTLLTLLVFFQISLAHSRPIELEVRDYGWLTSLPPARELLDFYLRGVEDDLNEDQPILDPSRVNYGTANASVLASKGLGTDYVNDPEKFQVSVSMGLGWDNEKDVAIRDEISGAAAASSVTLGARLNPRLMGYVNFGTITHSRIIPSNDIDIAGDIKATNFGVHVRYDLVERRGSEWLGWGGIKLHTGYEYNKNTVDLTTTLNEPIEVDTGGAGTLEGRLTGKPNYRVETQTHSIPLEVSSSVFLLKVISLYGGLGADYNFGQSKGKGNVEGDISTLACTSGICVGETVLPQLQTRANYDAVAQVKDLTFRAFAGLQLDLPLRLRAFGQVEKMLDTEVTAVAAGLKYSF